LEEKHFSIEQIPPAATLMVRQAELYPNLLLKKLQLDEDEDGIHFGLFHKDNLTSVVSCFEKGNGELQFRKFATLKEYQHMGFGSALLQYILAYADERNFTKVWCNARTSALGFYAKYGFVGTEEMFSKDGIDFVIMEKVITI
jgi:GNAT superfamily N-acetyltransferase